MVALLAALLVSAAATARAQTVAYQSPMIDCGPGGVDLRQTNQSTVGYISHADCVNDQAFVFPIALSTQAGFEVYASSTADCSTTTSRGTAIEGGPNGCSQLPNAYSETDGTLTIRARDLVESVLQVDCDGKPLGGSGASAGTLEPGGAAVTLFLTFATNTDTSCTSGTASGACASWQTQVKLIPPPAPSEAMLADGDSELIVDLPSGQAPPMGGYYLFCAPRDAAATGTGGAGEGDAGSTPAHGDCPAGTSFPVDAQQPGPSSPHVCAGPIQYTETNVNIQSLGGGSSLEDGTEYVVAVAAYDDVFNISPLSPLLCGSPEQGQGNASGGGCAIRSLGASPDPLWPLLGLAALGGVGVVLRRDRRRRRR